MKWEIMFPQIQTYKNLWKKTIINFLKLTFLQVKNILSLKTPPQLVEVVPNENLVESNSKPDCEVECENEEERMDWGVPFLQCSTEKGGLHKGSLILLILSNMGFLTHLNPQLSKKLWQMKMLINGN
jgi:hypothetical protein